MASFASKTHTQSWQNLVQRQNQVILDGTVGAILADGSLVVSAQGITNTCLAIIDHIFSLGESVILALTDDYEYVVIGIGTTGVFSAPPGPSRPALTIASQNLHQAILRLVVKQNQMLKRGTVAAILAEGTLIVALKALPILARAASSQQFSIGQTVYAVRKDSGDYLVLGSL